MVVQIVIERNKTTRPGRGIHGRNAALGTLCLVLYVAMSLALHALLRTITGESWFIVSLAASFLVVALLYGKLETWCGLEPEPARIRSSGAE
ncbi:MAG TPA: hypothetical protein VKF41_03450 [Bryobacteraceae bacterium]|nr:hypothetical protein [Bryobacteraceae bacterium]